MFFLDFLHRSIKNWPSGFQKGRDLCGRGPGLVGVTFVALAKARFARYGHAHKVTPQAQGHAHKGLDPFGTQKANSRSIDVKNPKKTAKTLVGVAIKKWAWQRKGRDICPPPVHIYCPSNSTQKKPVI